MRLRRMMTTTVEGLPMEQPAGFWRRMFAGVFDILFLSTMAMGLFGEMIAVVALAEYYGWAALDALETETILWTVLGLVWYGTAVILLPVLYYTLTEGAFGQTLGKALFGIVVVSADGRPIGYGRAFARLLTLPYALFPVGLGLLWAVLPPAKRAWHDYISATRVISVA
jgi:uncharacterized RDD family membrane protein YckC